MADSKPNPYLIDDENPEWTAEDFDNARPAHDVLHEIFSQETTEAMLSKKRGRPIGIGVNISQNIRLDHDILAAFTATGKGWQKRMNDALREWLKEHPLKTV